MSLINAALVFFLLWDFMPKLFLLIWLAVLILISLFRVGVYRVYWFQRGERQDPHYWRRLYLAGAYVSGAAWGVLIYVATTQDIVWLHGFIGFITAGVTAGGLIAMSPVLSACIPYALLVTLPFTYALLAYYDSLHVVMALMSIVYTLFLVRTAVRIHHLQLQSIKPQLEGDELFNFLKDSKRETEQLKESLAAEIGDYGQLQNDRELFFEDALDPFCIIGSDGHINLANPAMEQLIGLGTGNLRLQTFVDMIHPDDRGLLEKAFAERERGTHGIQFKCRLQHSDGNWVPMMWRAAIRDGRLFCSARQIKTGNS